MQFNNQQSVYSQITDYLKKQIFSGVYEAGQKMPAIRELAVMLKVNPNTVVRAYSDLESEGLIYTESTNGKFVINDTEFLQKSKINYIKKIATEFSEITKECKISNQEIMSIMEEIYGK